MRGGGNTEIFGKLKWMIRLHAFLIVTMVLDLVQCQYISPEVEEFFRYDEGIMISSLLVVWTFITVVIGYYIEKKEEIFYGLRTWDITSAFLSKDDKARIAVVFLAELLILLFSAVIHIPITLVYLVLLLTITLAYTFRIVIKSTDKKEMDNLLRQMIKEKYNNCGERGDEKSDIKIHYPLSTVIAHIDVSKEDDLDFLINLLDYFFKIESVTSNDIYYVVMEVMLRMRNHKERTLFLQNLVEKEDKIERLSSITLPLLCMTEENPANAFGDVLSVIKDDKIRRELMLRGIVYNEFLDEEKDIKCRFLIHRGLRMRLPGCVQTYERAKALDFWKNLRKTSEESSMCLKDILEALQ